MPGVKAGDDEDADQRYSYTTTHYLFLLCVTTVKKKDAPHASDLRYHMPLFSKQK